MVTTLNPSLETSIVKTSTKFLKMLMILANVLGYFNLKRRSIKLGYCFPSTARHTLLGRTLVDSITKGMPRVYVEERNSKRKFSSWFKLSFLLTPKRYSEHHNTNLLTIASLVCSYNLSVSYLQDPQGNF